MVSVSELGYLRKKEVELCGAQQKSLTIGKSDE
jgi:hypothetical protein